MYNNYTIAFRPSKAHGNADAMSRLLLTVQPATIPQPPEMILLMEQLDESRLMVVTRGAKKKQAYAMNQCMSYLQVAPLLNLLML